MHTTAQTIPVTTIMHTTAQTIPVTTIMHTTAQTTPVTTASKTTNEKIIVQPSTSAAMPRETTTMPPGEVSYLTDFELNAVQFTPDYKDPSSKAYKDMEVSVTSAVSDTLQYVGMLVKERGICC
jgi:hypothetical protein